MFLGKYAIMLIDKIISIHGNKRVNIADTHVFTSLLIYADNITNVSGGTLW